MAEIEVRSARVAGIPMRWLERPGELPVVALHGIPTSPALWRHVIPLVPRARILAWELVGFGGSWAAAAHHDIAVAAQAEHLLAWLDHLELERVVLVAHDLGAGVAQVTAVRHTDRVAGLALTDGIAYDNWPVPPIRAVRALGDLIARLPRDAFAAVYAAIMRLLHDDARRGRESARLHWRAGYAHDRGAAAFVRQVRSLRTDDTLAVAERLPRLRDLPVSIAWGGADRLLPVAWAERLAADLDAELEVIPGARHFTPEDHPEPVARAVRRVVGLVG